VLPEGKKGVVDEGPSQEKREPGDGRGPARHSALLGLCWDDWRDGGREKLRALMER
jgi:hypothetical protein